MYNPSLVLLVSVGFVYVRGNKIPESGCNQQETCGDCIKYASERCVWCPAKNATKRCQTEAFSRSDRTWCAEDVESPPNKISITQEEPLSLTNAKKVHLTPQKIKIEARPGVPETFDISYQLGLHYPLDVYFLMDFSSSMTDYSDNLKAQISEIHETLSKVSTNVQLGLGSFVDKPALPVVENHINLTDSLSFFIEKIKSFTPNGANFDVPEAGLEALMQVILCKDHIGWRAEALRIIVLFTDSTYHSAGDGKIVGAFRPFDMKCHLKNDEYSMALTLDYPSVGQISQIVKEENVQVIFAIHNKVKLPYQQLANQIEGAKCTNLKDSSDIPKIISQSYMDLLRFPRLNIIRAPPTVLVQLDPPCFGHIPNKPECEVENFESKNLSITITLTKCADGKIPPVEIGIVGLSEKLRIDVESICECDCEKQPGQERSEMCNGFGTYQCGVCKCDVNRSGDTCYCEGARNANDFDYKCIRPNEISRCSERGECRCGKCENCRESHGPFCQFSDSDCPQPHQMVCGNHGRCTYGHCRCDPGWRGQDCTCSESEDDCIDPYTQKVCAGHGECNCGKCACFKSEKNTQYTGKFCDDCSNCAERRCKELESFVECFYNSTMHKNKQEDCWKMYHQKKDIVVTFANKTEINAEEYRAFDWCNIVYNTGSIVYRHTKMFTGLGLVIQKDLDIPPKANIWIVVYTIIGVMLLIGLVIFITWRILIDIHDAREFNRFKEEVEDLDFDTAESNAIYKPACTEVTNPRYRRSIYNN